MALQFVAVACMLVAAVSAQYGGYGYRPQYAAAPEPYAPANYNFEYSVYDPTTYDIKSQKESRNGDYVQGVYELYEPDGTKRIVEYSDQGYGFQAVVHKEPASRGYAAPAYSAPAYSAPAYSAPAYSAPAYRRY